MSQTSALHEPGFRRYYIGAVAAMNGDTVGLVILEDLMEEIVGDEVVLRDHNIRLKVMEMDGLRVSLPRLSSEGHPPPCEE